MKQKWFIKSSLKLVLLLGVVLISAVTYVYAQYSGGGGSITVNVPAGFSGSATIQVGVSGQNANNVTLSNSLTLNLSSGPVNGSCGSDDGSNFYSLANGSAGACSSGTETNFSGTGPWTWACNGTGGGNSSGTCSANKTQDGVCGSACNTPSYSAPISNLCNYNDASVQPTIIVSGTGPWTWVCKGSNGGTDAPGTALKKQDGVCGGAATTYISSASAYAGSYCSVGTQSSSPAFPAAGSYSTWLCGGINGGNSSGTCVATHSASAVVNGACGSSNGQYFYSAPTGNLCSSGTASASGVWNWSCIGSGTGHTDASCSANQKQDGVCGAWSTTYAYSASFYGAGSYCSVGNPSASPSFPVAGSSASWTCSGVSTGNSSGTCVATHSASGAVNGACGPAAISYPSTATSFSGSLCNAGSTVNSSGSAISPSFPASGSSTTWYCSGTSGGLISSACTASRLSSVTGNPPSGYMDTPAENEIISGNYWVQGWALDNWTVNETKIQSVKLYLDNNFLGDATLNVGYRSDICNASLHVGWKDCPDAAWNYYWNSGTASIGTHSLKAVIQDSNNGSLTITKNVKVIATPSTCNPATVGTNQLSGCSFNGMNFNSLAGAAITGPVLSDPAPANGVPLPYKDWGLGGPNGLSDNYSVRFKGRFNFTPGSYTFSVGSDDGSRVYFDDNLDGIPDSGYLATYWLDRGYSVTTGAPVNVSAGNHVVVYEMYENAGGSAYSLSWTLISASKPTITLAGPPFTFSGVSGGATPASQSLVIGNSGNATLNWTWDRVNQAHNTSGVATWCKLQTAGGVDVPINSGGAISASGSTTYKVVVLSPSTVGTFQDCNIRISDANATNNPQYADITYTVTPSDACIGSGCGSCVGSICGGGSSNAVNASKLVCPAIGTHLSWVVGTGATSYNIYRATHGSSPVFLVNIVGNSYDDNSATSGFYDYWVESKTGSLVSLNKVAANTNSTGGISANTCGSGSGPVTVTIDNSTCGKITVNWSTVTGATSYNIYRNTTGNPPATGDRIKQGATGNSYVDSSAPGVYYYWVASVVSGAESAYIAPTVGSNPFGLTACIPNLSSSDKDIVAINGVGFTTGTCNGTDPLPVGTQLNLGDKVKFSLNFCNSGSSAATGMVITDKLTNLIMPAGGWNAKFNDGSGEVPISASNISVTGTAPNQVITFKNIPDVPKPGAVPPSVRRITFEAMLSVPTNFSATSARFQNSYTAVYNEGTTSRFTPLIQFYTGKGIPTIIEIP